MHKKKLVSLLSLGALAITLLSGCSNIENWELSMRSKIGALPLTVSTYDSNGQKIDQMDKRSIKSRLNPLIFIQIKRCLKKIVAAMKNLA
ncbi:MAG: hypothetical protein ACFWTI_00025 [Lactobacillus helveticus]|jgi:hypothetical protein